MAQATCSVEGCGRPVIARGWCTKHYQRWQSTGNPTAMRKTGRRPTPVMERFWTGIVTGDLHPESGSLADHRNLGGCWRWTPQLNALGYGMFKIKGKSYFAHRWSYELLVGPIPDGLVLDHLCRNPSCVNPAHLEAVTNRENGLRGRHAGREKTHCKHGHEFTPENTYVSPDGHRRCRTCFREYDRRRRPPTGRPPGPKPGWKKAQK